MKYKVTLNSKVYEVEVEEGTAMLVDEYEAYVPAPAPAPVAAAPVPAAAPAPAPAPAAAPVPHRSAPAGAEGADHPRFPGASGPRLPSFQCLRHRPI